MSLKDLNEIYEKVGKDSIHSFQKIIAYALSMQDCGKDNLVNMVNDYMKINGEYMTELINYIQDLESKRKCLK